MKKEISMTVDFGFGEAKLKWIYEGQEYALRMDREVFESLVHPEYSEIKKIGEVN